VFAPFRDQVRDAPAVQVMVEDSEDAPAAAVEMHCCGTEVKGGDLELGAEAAFARFVLSIRAPGDPVSLQPGQGAAMARGVSKRRLYFAALPRCRSNHCIRAWVKIWAISTLDCHPPLTIEMRPAPLGRAGRCTSSVSARPSLCPYTTSVVTEG
jgi:hypothetical protein